MKQNTHTKKLTVKWPRVGFVECCTLDSFVHFGAIYIVCLFTSYASPRHFFLHFLLTYLFALGIDPLHFQAEGHKR